MRFQLPLTLLVASTTAACITDDGTKEADQVLAQIEQENGGFTTEDEEINFGQDAEFALAAIESDSEFLDPMADDAANRDGEARDPDGNRDGIIGWGRMPADRDNEVARDWSGELRLSRGGVNVRRRLGFEDATDRVHPRTDRAAIRFDSRTRPFVDGLALRVIDDPDRDRNTVEPLRLRYANAAGDVVRDLDLSRADDRVLVEDMGDGNRIVVIANRRNDSCQHGFIRGRWHKVAANVAVYRGVVMGRDGTEVGRIRGIAGKRRNGEAVMFGKFISRLGEFSGLLNGTYENGEFHARWLDRSGDHGVINGAYFESENERGGGILARWAETSCANAPR